MLIAYMILSNPFPAQTRLVRSVQILTSNFPYTLVMDKYSFK